ncbi:hypothetical protein PMAYCL1PPCAC_04043, partial [Pristionchus mayeri]
DVRPYARWAEPHGRDARTFVVCGPRAFRVAGAPRLRAAHARPRQEPIRVGRRRQGTRGARRRSHGTPREPGAAHIRWRVQRHDLQGRQAHPRLLLPYADDGHDVHRPLRHVRHLGRSLVLVLIPHVLPFGTYLWPLVHAVPARVLRRGAWHSLRFGRRPRVLGRTRQEEAVKSSLEVARM